MSPGSGIYSELKRRNVFRVSIAYVVVGWVVLQVAEFLQPLLRLPEWTVSLALYIGIIGFPFALLFAWAFELTPSGLKRTAEVDQSESIVGRTGAKLNRLTVGLLLLVIAGFAVDKFTAPNESVGPVVAKASQQTQTTATEEPAAVAESEQKSIAVLPFVNMSGDEDYFADGLSEELLNLLTKIPGLNVTARTSSFKFKGQNEDLRLIGEALNVTTVLEGSVRRSGARLRVTAQLINVADGYHLWSEIYDREMTDVFEMQDDIAANIIRSLKLQLQDGAVVPSSGLPTTSMEAYQLYLEAKAHTALNELNLPPGEAAAKYRRALALDPSFVEAHIGLAEDIFDRAGLGMPYDEAAAIAREHAAAVLAIDPDHLWARSIWLYAQPPVWPVEETMAVLRQAAAADPNNTFAFQWLMWSLVQFGYGQETLDRIDAELMKDPLAGYLYLQRSQALRILGRDEEARAAMVEFAGDTPFRAFYWFALEALRESRDADATAFMEQMAASSGDLLEDIRRHFKRLVNADTRDAETANPGLSSKYGEGAISGLELAGIYYLTGDERLWDVFAEMVANNNPDFIVTTAMVYHDPAILNDSRFRQWADERGFSAFWRKHGVPDFCDGTLVSWVCELGEAEMAQ
jgi:TolB-like protein